MSTVPYSTALLNYLLKEPGVNSYFKVTKNEIINTDKVFTYLYISRNKYNDLIGTRYLGNRSSEGFTLPYNRTPKELVPPNWSRGDIAKLQKLFDDPEAKLIALPITLLGKYTIRIDPFVNTPENADDYFMSKRKSYKPSNEGNHSLVLLYNKQTSEIEVIDYDYGKVKIEFNYDKFIENDLLFYIKPILETFGVTVTKILLPQIHQVRFGELKQTLKERGLPYDFNIMYKVFLASYIKMRSADPVTPGNELASKIIPYKTARASLTEAIFNQYMQMSEAMGINPMVSSWIPSVGDKIVPNEFTKPCPENQVRDFKTGDCVPAEKEVMKRLNIVEEYSKGKHSYPTFTYKWLTLILRYWNDKYKNLAVMIPKYTYSPHPYYYSLQYNYTPRKKSATTHMKFLIPPDFYEFIDLSMNDPSKRFIALFLGMNYQGKHANPIIIDKVEKTVERIEINAPHLDFHFGYNDKTPDELLQDFFEKDPNLSSYGLKYIHAMAACPHALHRGEYIEPTEDVPDIGGRCADWTLFYIELKVANPSIEREKLYSYALETIRKTGSIKHFIYGYIEHIVNQSKKYKIKDYNRTLHPILSMSKKERTKRILSVPRGTILVTNTVLPKIPTVKAKSAPEIVIPTLDSFIVSESKKAATI